MKTPIILTNPTDEQLEAAFAEHVAGWRDLHHDGVGLEGKLPGRHQEYVPDYLSSFDAVLPYLEDDRYSQVDIVRYGPDYPEHKDGEPWQVDIYLDGECYTDAGPSLAHAAVAALLRANGVTVNLG